MYRQAMRKARGADFGANRFSSSSCAGVLLELRVRLRGVLLEVLPASISVQRTVKTGGSGWCWDEDISLDGSS